MSLKLSNEAVSYIANGKSIIEKRLASATGLHNKAIEFAEALDAVLADLLKQLEDKSGVHLALAVKDKLSGDTLLKDNYVFTGDHVVVIGNTNYERDVLNLYATADSWRIDLVNKDESVTVDIDCDMSEVVTKVVDELLTLDELYAFANDYAEARDRKTVRLQRILDRETSKRKSVLVNVEVDDDSSSEEVTDSTEE